MRQLYAIFFLFIFGKTFPQNNVAHHFIQDSLKKVVLMKPTEEIVGDLPEMVVLEDSTALYKKVMASVKNSFINDFIDLYFIAQIYLKNKGTLDEIEPAYLALTKNQGGFAKTGFAIKHNKEHSTHPQTPYVDITVDQATSPQDKLMSLTQLYPHEMGHVLFHLLSPLDSISNNTKNVDMHFFSVVTDYSVAFNEGFAEHIENVSRHFEKNDSIKSGIFADIEKKGQLSKPAIQGFKRDFKYPFRLGFYKASMLSWYQKFEDYKRYEQAINGDIRYKSATLDLPNTEDELTYRNSGVELNKNELRNMVQLHSTEGAISSFFTHLSTSELANHYVDPKFYQPFVLDSSTTVDPPQKLFTPIQNQFIKYFVVLHNYVTQNNSEKSQLIDFIEGYINEFPSEENEIKSIYQNALGSIYTKELPPPLWLMVKDYQHRLLVFDPFDAITIPVYTFDLNAAEITDLVTIDGISKSEAQAIINHKNTNGFFTDLNQIKLVPNLSKLSSAKIQSAALENDYLEKKLENFEPKLGIATLLIQPLKYIFLRAAIYFVFLFVIIYFFFIKPEKYSFKHTLFLFIKYLVLWVLFVLVGSVSIFMFGQALSYLILFSLILILLTFFIYRRRKKEMLRTVIFVSLMYFSVLISSL